MKVTRNELKDIVREVVEELELMPEAKSGFRKVVRQGKLRKKRFCKPGQKAVNNR